MSGNGPETVRTGWSHMFMHRIRALMGVAAVSAAAVIGSAVPALAAANQSAATSGTGYDVLTPNGGVHNFGAPWYGSDAGKLGKQKASGWRRIRRAAVTG